MRLKLCQISKADTSVDPKSREMLRKCQKNPKHLLAQPQVHAGKNLRPKIALFTQCANLQESVTKRVTKSTKLDDPNSYEIFFLLQKCIQDHRHHRMHNDDRSYLRCNFAQGIWGYKRMNIKLMNLIN